MENFAATVQDVVWLSEQGLKIRHNSKGHGREIGSGPVARITHATLVWIAEKGPGEIASLEGKIPLMVKAIDTLREIECDYTLLGAKGHRN